MANLLNIYGLDYKTILKTRSHQGYGSMATYYYFAKVANSEYFNLRVFSRQQLEQHVDHIASEYNIVESAKDIHIRFLN